MKRHTRSAATVALLALALLGSACTDGDEVPPDRVVTPSPAPSEPPPKKPVMPEAATEKTITGAREFTEHYYNLVEYGHATGKWRPLEKLSRKDCDVCTLFWTKHQQLFDQNEDVVTKVQSHNTLGIQDGRFEVNVLIEVGADLEDARSRVEKRKRLRKEWQDETKLAYTQQGWKVIEIKPSQLLPYESCIAGRCSGYQKEYATGGDDG